MLRGSLRSHLSMRMYSHFSMRLEGTVHLHRYRHAVGARQGGGGEGLADRPGGDHPPVEDEDVVEAIGDRAEVVMDADDEPPLRLHVIEDVEDDSLRGGIDAGQG